MANCSWQYDFTSGFFCKFNTIQTLWQVIFLTTAKILTMLNYCCRMMLGGGGLTTKYGEQILSRLAAWTSRNNFLKFFHSRAVSQKELFTRFVHIKEQNALRWANVLCSAWCCWSHAVTTGLWSSLQQKGRSRRGDISSLWGWTCDSFKFEFYNCFKRLCLKSHDFTEPNSRLLHTCVHLH